MTDTTPAITFDDIVNLGKKRVDETTTVDVPALGGSVVLRQLSGADQDAAVAAGHAAQGGFDAHVVAREQIKSSLVEPALPADEFDAEGRLVRSEANEILDNLPVKAFGELQALVQANSGLLGVRIEDMVAMFRNAAGASGADGDRADDDHGDDGVVGSGLAGDDASGGGPVEGVLPVEDEGAGDRSAEGGAAGESAEEDGSVTA